MSYMLDTNVLGESRKRPPDPNVEAWFASVEEEQLLTSVAVLGEIRKGHQGLLHKRDFPQARELERWIAVMKSRFGPRILPITAEIGEAWGRMSVPDPLPEPDGLIAATAHVHGLTIVTRNLKDFERTGVPCLNPFDPNWGD